MLLLAKVYLLRGFFEAFASIALGVVYERPSIAEKRLFSFSNEEVLQRWSRP